MATPRNIAVLVGSLRKESWNKKLARTLIELAPPSLKLEIVEIGGLTLYNQDLENDLPADWVTFRDRVRPMEGVLFVTPEYNRSLPGVLKNAIDVGSRPYGKSVYSKKPAAVASSSIGPMGAFGANHHLRQSLVFLDMPTLQQPEVYIGQADKQFDASGKLTADTLRELLSKFMKSFADWVELNQPR
jgi:chromate reductase